MENLLFAFSLTLLAGLSTGIGSTISFFTKKINTNFLSIALGFSAGVMIYISLTELFTTILQKCRFSNSIIFFWWNNNYWTY